MFLKHNVHF